MNTDRISTLFNTGRCSRCSQRTACNVCAARAEDGYIIAQDGSIIDDAVTVYDYGTPIEMCELSAYYIAEVCDDDREYHTDYIYTEDSGCYYSRAHEEYLYQCDDCGRWFEYEDSLRYNSRGAFCVDCYRDNSVICQYHEHKYEYRPIGGTWGDDLIGLEIETDGYDGNAADCAEALDNEFNSAQTVLAFEEDCSLYSGFETITYPHTLDALRGLDFDRLIRLMLMYGADENPGSAGIHMHFSRSWFGADEAEQTETIARLICEYNYNWEMLCDCSRRPDDYGIDEYAACPRAYGDTPQGIYDYQYRSGRYEAINLRPDNTVEFRLGGCYMDADWLRAWIELHVAMIRAARRGESFLVNYDLTISARHEAAA